jgi:hypothetical protein
VPGGPEILVDDTELLIGSPLPLVLRHLHAGLRASPPDLAERHDALVEVAVQDLAHTADRPVIQRHWLASDPQPLHLDVAETLRPGDALGVELLRDARETEAVGRQAEDPPHDLRLLLVDDQPCGPLHAGQALVRVAVHAPADDVPTLEPRLRRVAHPRGRLLPLALVAPAFQRRQQLRGVVRERDPAAVASGPDLDAGLLDVADQHHRVDLVAAKARLLNHDQLPERHRRRARGGQERLQAGPLGEERARDPVVGEDVLLVERPPSRGSEGAHEVTLRGDRLHVLGAVLLVVRLTDVGGSGRHGAFPLVNG